MIKIPNAQVYKVGGCVRDDILGISAIDNDYVVVGSNVKQMLSLGFKQVGKNFPVFLHPNTREEYALARSEKKVSAGHTGFSFDASEKISLLDDLSRRDLTINAIAQDEYGNIIDPFGGVLDLKNRVLRHVSHAFVEDPLRVLRIARFQARFNFTVADETMLLIRKIVEGIELTTISKERIWGELHRALTTDYPLNFFNLLGQIGAFEQILTEFNVYFQIKHLNINWLQTVCKHMVTYNYTLNERLAILFYAVCQYKNYSPEQACTDLGLNRKAKQLGKLLIKLLPQIYKLSQLTAEEIFTLINLLNKTEEECRQQFIKLATHIAQINNTEKVFFKQMTTTNLLLKEFSNINYLELIKNTPKHQQVAIIKQFKLSLINNLIKQLN